MKYIRTKDNIYEIVNDYGSSCAIKSKGKRGRTAIDGFTIKYGLSYAPRADTIEELCDEFVLETTINDKLFRTFFREHKPSKSSKFDMFKESWEIFNGYPQEIKDKKIHNYYGAIWTDKGLICVAKMNDKGELELL